MEDNRQMELADGGESEPGAGKSAVKLPVARVVFQEGKGMNWRELFEGFTSIKIITFSTGLDFLKKVLSLFEDAEVIFGCEQIMSYTQTEIMALAFQSELMETVRNSKSRDFFLERLKNGTLRLYVAREKLSHEKLYLLSSSDGGKRVITGSANMSNRAFSGIQRENIVYMDGEKGYGWYEQDYEDCLENSVDRITEKAVLVSDAGENMEFLPVSQTIKDRKVLTVSPNSGDNEDVEFALKVDNQYRRLLPLAPKAEKSAGRILLTPQYIRSFRQNVKEKREEEKVARREYPMLRVDCGAATVTLNEKTLDLQPAEEEVRNDVSLFLDFMDGYRNFIGEWRDMQKRYYAFANWFFCSPFMAVLRKTARLNNVDRTSYPVFGILYGQSKAGKTTFLKMLLNMMIGQSPVIPGKDFTRTVGDGLRMNVEGVPIVVDDIMKTRFEQNAPELIKNDDFGNTGDLEYYPAIAFSANTDMETIKPEYSRRAVCVNVAAGLPNEKQREMSTKIGRINRKITTALYREYLRRMLHIVPEMTETLKTEGDLSEIPDVLNASSKVLSDIFNSVSNCELPDYVRELRYEDYFGSDVLGKNVKDKICRAWRNNRKCFTVKRKCNELSYDTGDIYEPKRLRDELPEKLESKVSRTKIVMRWDAAREFFGINFR